MPKAMTKNGVKQQMAATMEPMMPVFICLDVAASLADAVRSMSFGEAVMDVNLFMLLNVTNINPVAATGSNIFFFLFVDR